MKRPSEKEFHIDDFTIPDEQWGCHISRVMIQYIKNEGKSIKEFLRGCPYTEEHLCDMNETFDGDWGREFYRRCRLLFNDYDIMRKMFYKIPLMGNNFLLTIIKILGTPRQAVKEIPEFNKKYNKTAKCKIIKIENDEAILIWKYAKSIKQFVSAGDDSLIIGSISGIPQLWDMPDIKIRHPKSSGKIDTYGAINGKVYRIGSKNEVIEYESDITGNIVNTDSGKIIGKLNEDGTFKLDDTIYGCDYCEFHLQWTNRRYWDIFLDRIPLYKQVKKQRILEEAKVDLQEQLLSSNKQYAILAETREREKKANEELVIAFANLKAQRLHEKKLEELMTGGFAHEIRNALAGPHYKLLALIDYQNTGQSIFQNIENVSKVMAENLKELQDMYHIPKEVIAQKIISPYLGQLKAMENIEKTMNSIEENVKRALDTTKNIREYSKLGALKRGTEIVDVYKIARSYQETFSQKISELRIDYSVHIENAAALLKGDPNHIDSIMRNLVMNAIDSVENMQEKKISVTLSNIEKEGIQYFRIIVQDSGEGIPEDKLKDIFEPFYSTKPTTGTGLGLSYVEKLIEIYEGAIDVKSKLGKGSSFIVDLRKNG